MEAKTVVNEATMTRTLARLAHEIIEQNPDSDVIYLIGIRRRGVPLAAVLKENIEKFSEARVELGELDITLYRDDLSEKYEEPVLNLTNVPFDVTGKNIVMVDDVIYTGRTARAAMDAIIRLGRPSRIQLAVMVDRGHRELPISANFVGKNLPTSRSEFVSVRVREIDGANEVVLYKNE